MQSAPNHVEHIESTKSLETKLEPQSAAVSSSANTIITPSPEISNDEVKDSFPFIDKIVYGIAALIFASILAFGIYKFLEKKDPYIDFATTENAETFTLPDGTEVVLDPHSLLSYPREMDSNRRLSLLGSATLDVKGDSEPLILESGEVSVMTLGTEFDLEAIGEAFVVECTEGRIRFYETENTDNNVEVDEGEKFRYEGGVFKDITERAEVVIPESLDKDKITLLKLLDFIMENSDWKVISIPSMLIDEDHEIIVNLDQPYLDLLESLDSKIDIEYNKAPCEGCYEITRMKAN